MNAPANGDGRRKSLACADCRLPTARPYAATSVTARKRIIPCQVMPSASRRASAELAAEVDEMCPSSVSVASCKRRLDRLA